MRRVTIAFAGLGGLVMLLISIYVVWPNWPITIGQHTPVLTAQRDRHVTLPASAPGQGLNDTIVELQNPQLLDGAKVAQGPLDHPHFLGQPTVTSQLSKASACPMDEGGNAACTTWVVSETDPAYIDPEIDGNGSGVYHFNVTQPNGLEMAWFISLLTGIGGCIWLLAYGMHDIRAARDSRGAVVFMMGAGPHAPRAGQR